MGTFDVDTGQGADDASHVPVAVFGERGMDHRPEPRARVPIAAGLFGVASAAAVDPLRPAEPGAIRGFGRMTS